MWQIGALVLDRRAALGMVDGLAPHGACQYGSRAEFAIIVAAPVDADRNVLAVRRGERVVAGDAAIGGLEELLL